MQTLFQTPHKPPVRTFLPIFCLNLRQKGMENPRKSSLFKTLFITLLSIVNTRYPFPNGTPLKTFTISIERVRIPVMLSY